MKNRLTTLLKKANWFKLSETAILLIGYLILLWMLYFGFYGLGVIWKALIG
jgi:hypothetical protein